MPSAAALHSTESLFDYNSRTDRVCFYGNNFDRILSTSTLRQTTVFAVSCFPDIFAIFASAADEVKKSVFFAPTHFCSNASADFAGERRYQRNATTWSSKRRPIHTVSARLQRHATEVQQPSDAWQRTLSLCATALPDVAIGVRTKVHRRKGHQAGFSVEFFFQIKCPFFENIGLIQVAKLCTIC